MTERMAVVTDNYASTKSKMTPCKLKLKSTAGAVQMFLLEIDSNFYNIYTHGQSSALVLVAMLFSLPRSQLQVLPLVSVELTATQPFSF